MAGPVLLLVALFVGLTIAAIVASEPYDTSALPGDPDLRPSREPLPDDLLAAERELWEGGQS